MRSIWAAHGIFGGVCFLTMGLPFLLAVGLVGLRTSSVWLSLMALIVGIGGLAASKVHIGRCRSCASSSELPQSNAVIVRGEVVTTEDTL